MPAVRAEDYVPAGTGMVREEPIPLSKIIDVLNERFGTEFNRADQLFFDQLIETAILDDAVIEAAKVNPEAKFALIFKNLLQVLFVERIDQNEEIFARYMNDEAFQREVTRQLAAAAYERLRFKELLKELE